MGLKSTKTVTRKRALELISELPLLPNSTLAAVLEAMSDSEESKYVPSYCNFNVSDEPN